MTDVRATTMMGRMTILPSTTTGRSLIACMPGWRRTALACGGHVEEEGRRRTEDGTLGNVDDGGTVEGAEDSSVGAG